MIIYMPDLILIIECVLVSVDNASITRVEWLVPAILRIYRYRGQAAARSR